MLEMGEKAQQSHQQEVNDQEEPKNLEHTAVEKNDNSILDQEHLIEDIKEARLESEGESDSVPRVEEEKEEIHTGELEDETKPCHQLEVHDQDSNSFLQTTIAISENPIHEQKQIIEDVEEARPDNKEENKTDNQNPQVGEEEKMDKKHAGILKKPKAVVQQKYLRTPTTAQPLSLATEKKMARERQGGSLQTTGSRSKLSKSVSLNLKADTQNLNGTKQISELKRGATITMRSTLPRNSTIDKRNEDGAKFKEKVLLKNTDSQNPKTNAKDGEERSLDNLKKSTTFKASPLPSFYQRKDPPPKTELKKVSVTRLKSPQIGLRSKSLAEGEDSNKKDINKSASRTISTAARDTIHRLLNGALKAPSSEQKKVQRTTSTISQVGKIKKETT